MKRKELSKGQTFTQISIMANLCEFSMLVKGESTSLKKVLSILTATYEYEGEECITCSSDYHLIRTLIDIEASEIDFDNGYLAICGDCAWSVNACMLNDLEPSCNKLIQPKKNKRITLVNISKMYNVNIEVYSQEFNNCFQEHYLIRNGEIEVEDCVDWVVEYDEERNEYITIEGYSNWEFSI